MQGNNPTEMAIEQLQVQMQEIVQMIKQLQMKNGGASTAQSNKPAAQATAKPVIKVTQTPAPAATAPAALAELFGSIIEADNN